MNALRCPLLTHNCSAGLYTHLCRSPPPHTYFLKNLRLKELSLVLSAVVPLPLPLPLPPFGCGNGGDAQAFR